MSDPPRGQAPSETTSEETGGSLQIPRDRRKCDCSGGCADDLTDPYRQHRSDRVASGIGLLTNCLQVGERSPYLMLTVKQSQSRTSKRAVRQGIGQDVG
jgi:hypothetical protein